MSTILTLSKKLNEQFKTPELSLSKKKLSERKLEWQKVLETMYEKIAIEQAYRFAAILPIVEDNIKNAAYCKDFQEFTAYFSLRRDIEKCADMETALLAMLHSAFQKKIDLTISESQK